VLYVDKSERDPRMSCNYCASGMLIEVAGSYGGLDLVETLKQRYGIVKS